MRSGTLKQISVLMATVFADMVGFTMVLPLLPFYATRLGANATVVGALVASYAFAQLLASPLWGRASDRYGRRPLILAGLLASAVAYVLFGLADALWLLFASRLVQGSGGGITGVVQAYVADSVEPDERAKAFGWLTAATSAGVMIGPAMGSLAAAYLGRGAPGFIAAGLCALNVLFAWLWLREPLRTVSAADMAEPAVREPLRRTFSHVLSHPTAPVSSLIWIYAIGMMGFMAMNAVLALYLKDVFGVTEKSIGYFYAYVGAISLVMRAVMLGPAVRRFGEVGVTRLGALCLVVGLACIPLPRHIAGLALVVLLVPVGTALLFPATTALVSRRSPRSETGQVLGVQQSFGSIARMVGPLWSGFVFQRLGQGYPFWLASLLMLMVSLLTLRQKEDAPPAVSAAPEEA
ncbi:MAG TPA: MFS transporter [Thermoanaerobaculia bacterium]